MVKKSKPKKATEKNVGGRPKRDPDSLRTERLVIRIHPDLMNRLTEISKRNGITRSLLVERALIELVNLATGKPVLDLNGREMAGQTPVAEPLGTPQSFQQLWRRAVGGSYVPPKAGGVIPPGSEPSDDEPEKDSH
jgi:hypothetical protein